MCEQNRVTIQWARGDTKDGDVNGPEEAEGWRDWFSKNLDEDVVTRVMEETERLAPQSCVVAVQAGTERATCYKQLGAGVVIAVGVHSVGEGMNVWEVTPPRLIVILKAEQKSRNSGREESYASDLQLQCFNICVKSTPIFKKKKKKRSSILKTNKEEEKLCTSQPFPVVSLRMPSPGHFR